MSLTTPLLRANRTRASNRFRAVLWAEWTKLRTVRGWVIALVLGAAATFFLCYESAAGPHTGGCSGLPAGAVCTSGPAATIPTGPGGEAVADTYEFWQRTLAGNGSMTAEITALAGMTSTNPANVEGSLSASQPALASWAKAGVIVTASTRPGSAYAAVMATGGHGIRFQNDYTNDRAGPQGNVSASRPRWLRLLRACDTITAYTSTNGTAWTEVGSAQLEGLPATVEVGVFATSPVSFHGGTGYPSLATATFAHLSVDGGDASNSWQGQDVGTGRGSFYPTLAAGSSHRSGQSIVISGSGDIAPAVVEGLMGTHTASSSLLLGMVFGMLMVIVVAAMFVTTEYRRGLIRTTFTAMPGRGQVLAAKGLVVGAVTFALTVTAVAAVVPLGQHLLRAHGNYVFPATTLTQTRIVIGAGVLIAMVAIGAIAVSAMLRNAAAAITASVAVLVVPLILAAAAGGTAATWLLRLTPAAGLSMLQALTHYSQVSYAYTTSNGYYPLSPLAGFAVLGSYTLLALAAATVTLYRRDA
jgi:ABC-type transport system involved in multi-copper enzyme maturation permease subunit